MISWKAIIFLLQFLFPTKDAGEIHPSQVIKKSITRPYLVKLRYLYIHYKLKCGMWDIKSGLS
jgi:hypothetical protein